MSRKADHPGGLVSFLGALSLFFATIEFLFPKPIPFMRLGLANIPILVAIDILPFPMLALLTTIKVVGQGLVNGTLASYVFLFSAAGSITTTVVMYGVRKAGRGRISLIGTSVAGALASNLVQSLLSVRFIFGESALVIIPWFLATGLVSSIAVGFAAERFVERSRWYAAVVVEYGKTANLR